MWEVALSRPSWDEYFMGLAIKASEKSTCLRAQVGVFIAKNNNPVSTGYNGAPRGLPHCDCIIVNNHCIRAIHAEENAVLFAGRERTMGATLYTTHCPCYHCAGLIINAGIVRVVYGIRYGDGIELLEQAGIIVKEEMMKCDYCKGIGYVQCPGCRNSKYYTRCARCGGTRQIVCPAC